MADNAIVVSEATTAKFTVAADELTYSGDTAKVQLVRIVHVAGSEGSKTLTEIADTVGLAVRILPGTAGGLSTFHLVVAASDNATNVKASAGQVYSIDAYNNAASPRYLKFHNTAGTPTAGSGVVRTVALQAGTARHLSIPQGLTFATGIAITVVTTIADNGTTAVGSADCVLDIGYK